MIFDLAPLGDHPVYENGAECDGDKMWEKDGAARTLVSADLDHIVTSLDSIKESKHPTPDFVARLTDGRTVAVEHTRICNDEDVLLGVSLDRVQFTIRKLSKGARLRCGKVSFAFPTAPQLRYVGRTCEEMLRAMRETVRPMGTLREPFGPEYPFLHELGVHWTVTDPSALSQATVEPWLIETEPEPVAQSILERIAKKSEKHSDYLKYGEAVWLTIWVDVRFCLPTTVLHLLREMPFDRGPFEKVIVGCSTRALVCDSTGVIYHENFASRPGA